MVREEAVKAYNALKGFLDLHGVTNFDVLRGFDNGVAQFHTADGWEFSYSNSSPETVDLDRYDTNGWNADSFMTMAIDKYSSEAAFVLGSIPGSAIYLKKYVPLQEWESDECYAEVSEGFFIFDGSIEGIFNKESVQYLIDLKRDELKILETALWDLEKKEANELT